MASHRNEDIEQPPIGPSSVLDPVHWLTQQDVALAARHVYGMYNGPREEVEANSRVEIM